MSPGHPAAISKLSHKYETSNPINSSQFVLDTTNNIGTATIIVTGLRADLGDPNRLSLRQDPEVSTRRGEKPQAERSPRARGGRAKGAKGAMASPRTNTGTEESERRRRSPAKQKTKAREGEDLRAVAAGPQAATLPLGATVKQKLLVDLVHLQASSPKTKGQNQALVSPTANFLHLTDLPQRGVTPNLGSVRGRSPISDLHGEARRAPLRNQAALPPPSTSLQRPTKSSHQKRLLQDVK